MQKSIVLLVERVQDHLCKYTKIKTMKLHTRVEPVGRVAKMNWLNYNMGMKIHAICDTKNAILKYLSLDMWKFAQIWAFFSCTENFSKTKSPKKCFYSIIAQKNLNANFWKHVILIKSWIFFSSYGRKLTWIFINVTCFQKLALRFFWAIIE